jgi:hypothetical protein
MHVRVGTACADVRLSVTLVSYKNVLRSVLNQMVQINNCTFPRLEDDIKTDVKKQGLKMVTGFIWLSTGTSSGLPQT